MPTEGKAPDRVAQWVEKAENDLTAAGHLVKLGKEGPMDTVCFHAQQCAEKYIKAVLFARQIAFPKTHDLVALIALLPKDARPTLAPELQEWMTDFATTFRYPDVESVSLTEARGAIAAARCVRKEMRRLLPKAVPRRRT